MFNILFSIFISICEFLILQKYLMTMIGKRKVSNWASLVFFIVSVSLWSLSAPDRNPYFNLVITITAMLVFSFQYSCTLIIRFICIALYIGIGFLTEPLALLVFKIGDYAGKNYIVCIISELIRLIIVLIIGQMKMEKIVVLPKKISSMLFVIPCVSIVNYCLIIQTASSSNTPSHIILCITMIITIVAINYLLFFIFNKFNDMVSKKHEDDLYIQEMKHKELYYAEVQECNEYVQDIKHDLKNRLSALYDSVDYSNELAATKIKELLVNLENVDQRIYTDNPALNSILKIKLTQAKEYGISSEIKIQVPMNMKVDCGDLGIVYGNLLDNAIEACEKVTPENRFISLESKYIEGSLVLVVKNSKTSDFQTDLKTNKADKRNHGRGINSVKRVVEKYNGIIKFVDNINEFEVNAILYGIAS